jgi:hypothetical protein
MCAYIELEDRPRIDDGGLVVIPPGPREEAERTLEAMVDRIAVATDRSRAIRSPAQAVALEADGPDELSWLEAQDGIAGFDRIAASHGFAVHLELSAFEFFLDRPDGAALLADALSGSKAEDEFLGFLRLFERAFGESSDRLVPCLAAFLEARPGLEFTKTEVKRWITKLRGAVVHADKKKPLPVAGDYRPLIPRMKFAAYDVLLNKESWHGRSLDRRDAWTPTSAPLPDGGLVMAQRSEGVGRAQIFDAFGVYPLDLSSRKVELPDDHWPRHRGTTSRGPAGMVHVRGAEALAVNQSAPSAGGPESDCE